MRVIGAEGGQLGVMSSAKALEEAKKLGLTLVEIAPKANPPVVKIVDFGKFRYQEEKKLRAQLKKSKAAELKEVRFTPFIAENDYNTRFLRVKEFLGQNNKVRLVVVFKGPQLRSRQFGYRLLEKIVSQFGEAVSVDMEPKFLGKHLMMIISPVKKVPAGKKKEEVKETKEKKEKKETKEEGETKEKKEKKETKKVGETKEVRETKKEEKNEKENEEIKA